jgi:peptidoglycan L-alanyl-D-glutamate endopeptidase CwlK
MLESRPHVIVDSDMSFEVAMSGKHIPREIRESTDDALHSGQIVVHEDIAERVGLVFRRLLEIRFPVEAVLPASRAGWSDNELMKRNISSGFNFRTIKNSTVISPHGYGLAFDINPLLNPCFYQNGEVDPPGAVYDPKRPGTLTADGEAVRFIESLGLTWGGRWNPKEGPVDTQHVEDRARWRTLTERGE